MSLSEYVLSGITLLLIISEIQDSVQKANKLCRTIYAEY